MSISTTESPPTPREPTLTVAVIELVGGAALAKCASAVIEMARAYNAKVLIACRDGGEEIAKSLPAGEAEIIARAGKRVPERRLAAARLASSEIIAMIEDTTLPSQSWFEGLAESFADPQTAASWGPISFSQDLPARFRSLALMEYGRFAVPEAAASPSGAIGVPGNCMAFRRDALLEAVGDASEGVAEDDVVRRLRENGGRISFSAKMGAVYCAEDHYGARLATRAQHGRLYASRLQSPHALGARAAGALRALLIPLVLTLRGARGSLRHSSFSSSCAEIFWIFVMACAWGIGEFAGFVWGEGDSAGSWR